MKDHLNALLRDSVEQQGLPDAYFEVIKDFIMPLADKISRCHQCQQGPIVVGVNGGQGSGKTTLCHFLKLLLQQRQLSPLVMSIDDFYLSRQERAHLANDLHPLLRTRGVPGTHDIKLAISTIENVKAGVPCRVPVFDKSIDDLLPVGEWPEIEAGIDVIILEGWCVGATPMNEADLNLNANRLEAEEDPRMIWRTFVNQSLAGAYQTLFGMLDLFVMLKVPSMEVVYQWRQLQEQKLLKLRPDGNGVMSAEEVIRFVDHYERLTRHMLKVLPDKADVLFELGEDHNIHSARGLA